MPSIMTSAEQESSPVPALLPLSMLDSDKDTAEEGAMIDEDDFDFQFSPSVFKDLSRAIATQKSFPDTHNDQEKNASKKDDEKPKNEPPTSLEFPDLDMPMFPSATKSLSSDLQQSMPSQEVTEGGDRNFSPEKQL